MVDSDTERAVSPESFLNISKEMLCKVLCRYSLFIDEVVLFQAVDKWALKKLKEEGLEENKKNKRAVLGEEVIQLIRFPLMSEKTFVEKVLSSWILTMEEVTELLQFFNEVAPLKGSFSNTKRGKSNAFMPSIRFKSITTLFAPPNSCFSVAIAFKVNKPLSLAGVRLFGFKGSTYNVTLALYKSEQQITQISSTFPTEDEQTYGYYGFTIHLDEPVPLDPDVVYTIEASIKGSSSYYGVQGKTTIAFEDIVITYLDSKKSNNRTTTEQGQFPTMLFKRH